MMLALLATAALAATPRIASQEVLGSGITDVASAGSSARYVGLLEAGTGQVEVLDTATWDTTSLAPCSGGTATAIGASDTVSSRLFVGCLDGTLTWISLGDDGPSNSGATVSGSTQAIRGITAVEGVLVVLAGSLDAGTSELLTASAPGSLASGDALTPGVSFASVGFMDLGTSGSWAIVSQGDSFVGRVAPVGGSYVPNNSAVGANDLGDVLDTTGVGGEVNALLADATNGVVSFNLTTLDALPVLGESSGVESPTALALFDGQLLVADSGRGELVTYPYNSSTGLPGTAEQSAASYADDGDDITELVALDGYAVAGTADGEAWIYTDRPWVEMTADVTGTVTEGELITLTFSADVDGDWSLVLNPTDGDAGGATLTTGSLTADEEASAILTVDDAWVEGENQLRLLVADEDGLNGHDAVVLSIDSPPDAVTLRPADVAFGDEKLVLTIRGVSDADLAGYEIYVTTTEFSADDWNGCDETPCGGPAWDGEGDLATPLSVTASPSETVEVTVSPLDNDTTHYLAVRAIDAGGQEGSMSNVVTGTPRETYSAAQLAGEPGGFGCATTGGAAAGLLAALGGLLSAGRRRRGLLAAAVAAPLALASAPAQAQDAEVERPPIVPKLQDGKKVDINRGTVALRVGPAYFQDKTLQGVYGDNGLTMAWLEGGPRFSRLFAVTGGIGFLQKKANLVDADYNASADENVLQAIPLSANATVRLDIFREQVLVPYASVGGDYWLWRERWDVDREAGTTDSLGGGKLGYHWAVGGQILLDIFDRDRASRIQARRGVDDSYLVVEYRQQTIGDGSKLDFNASSVGVGLALAY